MVPALTAAVALAGCSSSTHSSAQGAAGAGATSTTAAASAAKSAFCSADTALDRAQSGVTSAAQEVQALKAHASLATSLGNDASGISDPTVATAARQIDAAVAKALSSGSANFPPSISADASTVNTFCGVQYNGAPLPAYFAAGKNLPACAKYATLNNQLRNATSAQEYLSLIESNQTEITKLVSEAPASIKGQAETVKTAADQAVSQKSLAPLQTASANQATGDVQLYCGIND